MARNLAGQLSVNTTVQYDPGLAVGTTNWNWPNIAPIPYTLGTSAGQLNLISYASGSAAASPATLDLTALTDPYGGAVNLAKVNYVLILNDSTADANFLLLDGTVSNAWKAPFNAITTAKLVIPPGLTISGTNYPGMAMLTGLNTSGLAVSGTSKVISLDPGANTIPYRILFLGR